MINADPRTRDSIWMGVAQSLASLADPRVLLLALDKIGTWHLFPRCRS